MKHSHSFLIYYIKTSSTHVIYVRDTSQIGPTLKKRPCCKLPCLLFDTSLTCEGKSLSTFRSFPTRVCQHKFALWRPLYIWKETNQFAKSNLNCKLGHCNRRWISYSHIQLASFEHWSNNGRTNETFRCFNCLSWPRHSAILLFCLLLCLSLSSFLPVHICLFCKSIQPFSRRFF